jgi:hypothetical protein
VLSQELLPAIFASIHVQVRLEECFPIEIVPVIDYNLLFRIQSIDQPQKSVLKTGPCRLCCLR